MQIGGHIVAWAVTVASAAPPLEGDPPGGYRQFGEITEREPSDGEEKVLTGTILLPLGALRAAMGGVMYVIASPTYCERVYGPKTSDSTCNGLQIFGLVGIGMGSLMAVTGAVFLGWGLSQRARHQRWMQNRGLAVTPMFGRGVHGVSLGFRF